MKELKNRWNFRVDKVNALGEIIKTVIIEDQGFDIDNETADYIAKSIELELNANNITSPGTYVVNKKEIQLRQNMLTLSLQGRLV